LLQSLLYTQLQSCKAQNVHRNSNNGKTENYLLANLHVERNTELNASNIAIRKPSLKPSTTLNLQISTESSGVSRSIFSSIQVVVILIIKTIANIVENILMWTFRPLNWYHCHAKYTLKPWAYTKNNSREAKFLMGCFSNALKVLLLLDCPASKPLRCAIFGTTSSIFDLGSRP